MAKRPAIPAPENTSRPGSRPAGSSPAPCWACWDFVGTTPATSRDSTVPTLIVCGRDDHDNGSPEKLAMAMPNARAVRIDGDHLSAVAEPALAQRIVGWLTA